MSFSELRYQVIRIKEQKEYLNMDLMLFFMLEGEATVRLGGKSFGMKKEDVFLVNPGMSCEVKPSNDAILGIASYAPALVTKILKQNIPIFYCNTMEDYTHSCQDLRDLFYLLTAEYISERYQTDCILDSLLFQLFHTVIENYRLEKSGIYQNESESDARMRAIMQYIVLHISEEISLSKLAEQMHMSTSTLSRIFKKNAGIYFADYVTKMRVNMAREMLPYPEQNMTRIAMDCGFANLSSFYRAFQKETGMTPPEYRKDILKKNLPDINRKEETELKQELREKGYSEAKHGIQKKFAADVAQSSGETIKPVWRKVVNIGPASELLRANVQHAVELLQGRLHIESFRIWNLFSEKIMVTDGKESGSYHFEMLHQVLDFLVQRGIRPFLDFGRRPEAPDPKQQDALYHGQRYIRFESGKAWMDAIKNFVRNIHLWYGDNANSWIFELSEDREHTGADTALYEDPEYRFFEAYCDFYKCIKAELPGAMVGGISAAVRNRPQEIGTFLKKSVQEGCPPDFVSFRMYSDELFGKENAQYMAEKKEPSEAESVRMMRGLMEEAGLSDRKLFITEWNITESNRNFLNDSCCRAARFVKTVEEIADRVDLLAVMGATDWIGHSFDSIGLVNGGIGILTKDSIPKPIFFAIDFLNMLSQKWIAKNENCIVTQREDGSLSVLCFYHSVFESDRILNRSYQELDQYMKESFDDEDPITLHIGIKHAGTPGQYLVSTRSLNRDHGCILDEWGRFLFHMQLNRRDITYLQAISVPKQIQYRIEVRNSDEENELKVELKPNEVLMMNISREK